MPYGRRVCPYQLCMWLSNFPLGWQPVDGKGLWLALVTILQQSVRFLALLKIVAVLNDMGVGRTAYKLECCFIFGIRNHVDHCDWNPVFSEGRARAVGRYARQSFGRLNLNSSPMYDIEFKLQ